MISDPAKNDFKPKKRTFGDVSILHGISTSPIFGLLITKPFEGLVKALGQFMAFNHATMTFAQNSLFRRHFGIMNCGIIQTLSVVGIMLIFNSERLWTIASPLYPLLLILPFFYDWNVIYQWSVLEIRSLPLLYVTGTFLISSLIHVTAIYFGYSNKKDMNSRGESWIGSGLSKLLSKTRIKPSEFFVAVFIESGLVIGIGYYFYFIHGDQTFGLFCFLTASSEIITQVKSKTAQLNRQAYLSS